MFTGEAFDKNSHINNKLEQSDISSLVRIAFTNNLEREFTVKGMIDYLRAIHEEDFSEDTIRKHMNKQCDLSGFDNKYVIRKSISRCLKEDGIKSRSYAYSCIEKI